MHKVAYRLLRRRPMTYWALNRNLLAVANRFRPHVVFVVQGAYISPAILRRIKQETNAFLGNYATDDPCNAIVNTRDLVGRIPLYDLYACTKRAIMDDVRKTGCKHAIYIPFGYRGELMSWRGINGTHAWSCPSTDGVPPDTKGTLRSYASLVSL